MAGIERVMRDICAVRVMPDGIVFDASTVQGRKIKEDADYEGVRVKFRGFLGRSRIPMQIDIGFGDSIYPKPVVVDYPAILDLPRAHLKGYPAESVISEKFEAMVKLGLLNSRMKDFYDIWLMMRHFDFDGSKLAEAFGRTFAHRKTPLPEGASLFAEEIYDETSDRQALWYAFVRKGELENVPDTLRTVAKAVEGFLGEPLGALRNGLAFNRQWVSPGPWR